MESRLPPFSFCSLNDEIGMDRQGKILVLTNVKNTEIQSIHPGSKSTKNRNR